jgi:predicted HicB family RNase H-like nuclease
MKHTGDNYLKIVEWSEEDQCYIGTSPGLLIGGVHGKDQKKVFVALCKAVDEALHVLRQEGRPLPDATVKKNYSGKIALRIPAQLHRRIAARALQAGESVNKLIQHTLEKAV